MNNEENKSEWEARFDLKTMKSYWKNLLTGSKTWKDPTNSDVDSNQTTPIASPSKPKKIKQLITTSDADGKDGSDRWEERFDPKKGKSYWKNLDSGEKTWKNPYNVDNREENEKLKPESTSLINSTRDDSSFNEAQSSSSRGRSASMPSAQPLSSSNVDTNNWQEKVDPKSGRKYWKNLLTGVKTWKNPHNIGDQNNTKASIIDGPQLSPSPSRGRSTSMPSTQPLRSSTEVKQGSKLDTNNWQEKVDPKSGRKYWKNLLTGVKTWKNPHNIDDQNNTKASITDGPQLSPSPYRGKTTSSSSTSLVRQSANQASPKTSDLEKFLASNDGDRNSMSPSRSRMRSSSLTSFERDSRSLAVHRSGPIMSIDDFKKLQDSSPRSSDGYSSPSKSSNNSSPTKKKGREVRLSSSLAVSSENISPSIIRNKGWNSGFRNAKSLSGPPTKHFPKSFLFDSNATTSISQER